MATKFPDKAPKRNKAQIAADRRRITELLLQEYTQQQIADIIHKETGTKLSRTTIRNDIDAIEKDWLAERRDNYAELLNRELSRIQSTEREVWRAWRASAADNKRTVVEEVRKQFGELDDGDDLQMVVNKVITTIDENGGVGDPRFIDRIITLQQERRKLLGLYAPARLGINIDSKHTIEIKGYGVTAASPDAWPDPIEGEYTVHGRKRLDDGGD